MRSVVCVLSVFCHFILSSYNASSQGCSDAGFCTMGAMKPDQPFNRKIALRLRSVELSFYRGTTSLTPVIYLATADLGFSINKKNSFQVKVPYLYSTGRMGSSSSLSDISLCLTRNIVHAEHYDINFSIGSKIPTNDSNKKSEDERPLPMYYQTSLGTYDAIAGISLITRNWLFATGVQHPFNKNGNKFNWAAWEGSPLQDYARKYPVAFDLQRGTDVMLRIERNWRFSRVNFTAGALPIYRVNSDIITRGGVREKLADGKGLALSLIATAGYSFNVKSGIKILAGHKITNRKINPDGLSRELVSTASYYYRF